MLEEMYQHHVESAHMHPVLVQMHLTSAVQRQTKLDTQ